jgi:hypothetical protein
MDYLAKSPWYIAGWFCVTACVAYAATRAYMKKFPGTPRTMR